MGEDPLLQTKKVPFKQGQPRTHIYARDPNANNEGQRGGKKGGRVGRRQASTTTPPDLAIPAEGAIKLAK